MKNTYIFAGLAGLALLLLIAAGLYVYILLTGEPLIEPTATTPLGSNTILPSNTSGVAGSTGGTDDPLVLPPVEVPTFASGKLSVRNPLADSDVVRASDRTGTEYYSLGSVPSGAHLTLVSVPTSTPTSKGRGYEILYFPQAGTFSVSILKEPLGDIRRAAADDLMRRLGIDAPSLCTLLAGVRVDVGGVFAGKYIGFAGCAGATALPGDQ